MLLAKKRDKKL